MWFKVDCGFFRSPDVSQLSASAILCYLQALAYCAENLTDGFIPYKEARKLAGLRARTQLCDHGLWTSGGKGYLILNYLENHPSAATMLKQREKWSKLKRRQRECPPVDSPVES